MYSIYLCFKTIRFVNNNGNIILNTCINKENKHFLDLFLSLNRFYIYIPIQVVILETDNSQIKKPSRNICATTILGNKRLCNDFRNYFSLQHFIFKMKTIVKNVKKEYIFITKNTKQLFSSKRLIFETLL